MRNIKRRIFEIIQIGRDQDGISIAFDFFIVVVDGRVSLPEEKHFQGKAGLYALFLWRD